MQYSQCPVKKFQTLIDLSKDDAVTITGLCSETSMVVMGPWWNPSQTKFILSSKFWDFKELKIFFMFTKAISLDSYETAKYSWSFDTASPVTAKFFSLFVIRIGVKVVVSFDIFFSTNKRFPLLLPTTIPLLKHFIMFGIISLSLNIFVICCFIIKLSTNKLREEFSSSLESPDIIFV